MAPEQKPVGAPLTWRQQQLVGLDTEASCWQLYVENRWTTRQVGEFLGIAPATVSRALKRAEKRAIEKLTATVTSHKALSLERLERLYALAMDGYAESIAERTRRRSKRRNSGEAGVIEETEIVTESKRGNPRFLAEARAAVVEIKKLLGLDAPTKVNIVDSDRPLKELTDEEVARELREALKAAGMDAATLTDAPPAEGERTH